MKIVTGLHCLIATFIICFVLGFNSIHAQSLLPTTSMETTVSENLDVGPPSPNDLKELIRLLEDQRIKNWLEKGVQGLDENEPEQSKSIGEGLVEQLSTALDRTRERGRLLSNAWQHLSDAPQYLTREWQSAIKPGGTVRSVTYVLIFLFIGGGLEWLYKQYTNRRLLGLQLINPASLSGRLRAAVQRAVLVFGGLAVFTVGSVGAFLSFEWNPFVEELVLILLLLVIALRAIATLSMFVLAPRVRELRLAPFGNQLAKQYHITIISSLSVMAIALAISDIFSELVEEGEQLAEVQASAFSVSILAGLICLLVALLSIWRIAALATDNVDLSKEDKASSNKQRIFNWRTYLFVLAIVSFVLWLFAATDLMWTALILGLLPAALSLTRGWANYFFDEAEAYLFQRDQREALLAAEQVALEGGEAGEGEIESVEAEPEEETEQEVEADQRGPYDTLRLITLRLFRFILVIFSVLVVLAAWGTDIFTLADSPTIYGKITSVFIDLIVAILIADLVWTWAKNAIDSRLANYQPAEGGHAPGPEARMATLLPLLRMILLVTLVIMVGLSVLSSAGVNIAPLIAGAGVLGVAIGFGAQSLVKDIVSGIFFLIDDAFRVGEYIEIGDLRGVVESMSIRSLRVRHHRGAVHTIPFGELASLTNYSRDWAIMKMEFRVPFETDIKLVKKIVKKIGAEMLEDPMYQSGFLEPLKSQGVRRMEEFNMVVGVKFMAKPGEQWVIRRDAYQKIVNAFEANDIRLPERNVKVEVVSDRELSDEEEQAIVGAAQQSIEPPTGPPVPVADEP